MGRNSPEGLDRYERFAARRVGAASFPRASAAKSERADETFTKVPDWLLQREGLDDGAKLTWSRIRRRESVAYATRKPAFMSIATLAQWRGISERTVQRHIRELASLGLLLVEAMSGTTNRYTTLVPTDARSAREPASRQDRLRAED